MKSKKDLQAVTEDVLSGRVDAISGVRRILALRPREGDMEEGAFLYFVYLESETEYFPVGTVREKYAPETLRRLDAERDLILADEHPALTAACRNLIVWCRGENGDV